LSGRGSGAAGRGRGRAGRGLDGLFRAPLGRFTGERDALAKRARAAGDAEGAARILALAKPSLPAWVVNQIYWSHRRELDRLLKVGARVRAVQEAGGGTAAALRQAAARRREAMSVLLDRAATILAEAGHAATRTTLRRIETSLEALAIGGGRAAEPPGRMTRELAPAGFEALLSLAAARPVREPGRREDRVADRRRDAARRREERRRARRRRDRARRAAALAAKSRNAAERVERRARRALEQARRRVADAEAAVGRAAATRAGADEVLIQARAELAEAEEALAPSRSDDR
jgi:hypothetical protein